MRSCWMASAAVLACLGPAAATAQGADAERVAAETDWSVFVEDDPQQCWVVSAPEETRNTRDGSEVSVNRGDIFLFASFWPESGKMGEISFMGGYPFAEGSTVEMQVGDDSFDLFTDGSMAWAQSAQADQAIAEAMMAGIDAEVVGLSSRGTTTTDTFSLMGFTAAYEDAQSRCAAG